MGRVAPAHAYVSRVNPSSFSATSSRIAQAGKDDDTVSRQRHRRCVVEEGGGGTWVRGCSSAGPNYARADTIVVQVATN
ncbi:hypothetical protein MRX96_056109 [Rhipicephalus microplus]